MREMSIFAFLSAVCVVTPVIADAQTKVLPAAAISAAEIQALTGPRKPNTLPNIRVVDAGGHNVGVGVLYRAEGQTQNTAVHFKVSEVYHVMKGSGTLVTGGTVVNPKTRAADWQLLHDWCLPERVCYGGRMAVITSSSGSV